MNTDDISAAAAAMGRKGGQAKTEAKVAAVRANGAKGGRPLKWHPAPARGATNPTAALYRFTVVRNCDGAERFTDRRPRAAILASPDFTAWDNRNNCKIG